MALEVYVDGEQWSFPEGVAWRADDYGLRVDNKEQVAIARFSRWDCVLSIKEEDDD